MVLDPNIAYVVLVLAFILGTLALAAPGTGFLELGAIALMAFAGYALFQLNFNLWALVVLIIGLPIFFFAVRPGSRLRQWIMLALALLFFWVGSVFLLVNQSGGLAINMFLGFFVSLASGGFMWFVFRKAIDAYQMPVKQSFSGLEGTEGIALTEIGREGTVLVRSENWSAFSKTSIAKHSRIKVIARQGLILEVEEIK